MCIRDSPYTGQGACHKCPAGKNCPTPGMSDYNPCPLGYYCMEGVDPEPCPAGTYGPTDDTETAGDCYPCDPGKFCTGKYKVGIGFTNSLLVFISLFLVITMGMSTYLRILLNVWETICKH
eukprot:TRINITY_DN5561_c0_g1_i1.p1 TRINITY_DN5561_c0_g1~~TRINITY_DN5561_c0_g1_i1.p1  ORF type:complete len:121 (-),score=6.65 TRINITY_DN5561_c0_g1_i1:313-675(-)